MKLTARIVGILFIIGTVAGILSALLTGSILDDQNYLNTISENETQLIAGAILVLVMGFSLAMIPVVLFPTFKKYNEALALGAVVFRGALEAFAYIAIAVIWLSLVGISREYISAGTAEAASFQALGVLLRSAEEWIIHILAIVFSLGALMIYWLFYISRLIPRWLSVWGLIGAVLYLATPLLDMFVLDQLGALMAPLALQEMVLAIWLIIKGFNLPSSKPRHKVQDV